MKNILPLLCVLFISVACAPKSNYPSIDESLSAAEQEKQKTLVVEKRTTMENRLQEVSYPILAENEALCEDKAGYLTGLFLIVIPDIEEEWQGVYKKKYGNSEYPIVKAVSPGSPAEKAGLMVGDVVMSINGEESPHGKRAWGKAYKEIRDAAEEGKDVLLVLQRGNEEKSVTLTPELGCDIPVYLVRGNMLNAYTDGKNIFVYDDMVDFCEADQELATIVGHELAHAAMGHVESKQNNAMVGSIFDALLGAAIGVNLGVGQAIGAGAYSQEFEKEADYVGLYMAARGGYEVEGCSGVWRKMAVEHPDAITHASSHPHTADRYLGLDATAKEIAEKKESNAVLMPSMKD